MAKLHVFDAAEKLYEDFAQFLADVSKASIDKHNFFSIGLSGGSSATIVSKALMLEPFCQEINWSKWHVFFCDERCVSLSDKDSNYNAMKTGLFDKVAIPVEQIYTINSDLSPKEAALDYENNMKKLFGNVQLPGFDLLVLGMGPDGHICSLFPNHPLLDNNKEWVAWLDDSPKPPPRRVTMTLPVLNNAMSVCFTVTGQSKAEIVKEVHAKPNNKFIPASLVNTSKGNVHWFMDKDAAVLLQ